MSRVVISKLRKQFGQTVALADFDLTVADGEFVALLGPSGCGKTTVLRCLAGLERPTHGRIAIGDKVVEDVDTRAFIPTQKRDIGLVFQSYALWPHMSVAENLAYPLKVHGFARNAIDRKVAEMLDLVGLTAFRHRGAMELSGGQQQRVALARALIGSPAVLLLDEPLSNLDAERRTVLRKQLRDVHRKLGTTTVYVTHDQVEALTMADRVLVMNNGRVEQSGPPRDIFERPASRFVASFLGYENIVAGRVTGFAGGNLAVDVPGLGTVEVAARDASRPAAGSQVEIAFRAANLALHRKAPASRDNTTTMQVEDRTYLGDTVEYTLRAGRQIFIARTATAGTNAALGAQVHVSLAPASIVLFGRTQPAQQALAS